MRKLRIDARRVEGFADDVQLQFAVFEEFERAFGVEFAAVLRNQADFVELERTLAELFVGLEKQHAVRARKSAVEIPVDDGGGGFAFDVDTAVQTACDVLTDKVVRAGIVDAQCEFELVLGGVDRAGYINAAVFEQADADVFDFDRAFVVDDEFAEDAFDGDMVFIGKTGLVVFQVNRAFQRNAVGKGRNGGGVEIQTCFGQGGQEGLRIDVGTFNQDFADGFVEAVGEWVDGGFGRQMNVVAVEQQVGVHVLQTAPQAHRAVYGFALKLAFGVDGGIEDVGFVQTEHHRACRAAPGRVGGFDVEAVFFFVVMIGRVQMVEIDGLLVKTLAHADFAGFQTVEIGGNG